MVTDDRVSAADMAQLVADGRAEPLLPTGTPGPVRLDNRWWAVRSGDTHYQPADPIAAATFEQEADRLAAYRAHRMGAMDLTRRRQ